ncbi:MAG TPA: hypothetical protein VF997_06440, partial [Polyangia bacterium]
MKRLAWFVLLLVAARAGAEEIGGNPPPAFGENASRHYESPQRFAVELKFGPYSPNIDASQGVHGTPFADLFPPANGKTRP